MPGAGFEDVAFSTDAWMVLSTLAGWRADNGCVSELATRSGRAPLPYRVRRLGPTASNIEARRRAARSGMSRNLGEEHGTDSGWL